MTDNRAPPDSDPHASPEAYWRHYPGPDPVKAETLADALLGTVTTEPPKPLCSEDLPADEFPEKVAHVPDEDSGDTDRPIPNPDETEHERLIQDETLLLLLEELRQLRADFTEAKEAAQVAATEAQRAALVVVGLHEAMERVANEVLDMREVMARRPCLRQQSVPACPVDFRE